MGYRDFARPRFSLSEHGTDDWLTWMEREDDVLIPVAPRHEHSCTDCYGSVNYRDGGTETWSQCTHCRDYGDAIDVVVPITYSVDAGLESLLHSYKDFGAKWVRSPLASLLSEFLDEHGDCLERATPKGTFDVAITMPSNNTTRGFNHLRRLVEGAVAGGDVADRWSWDFTVLGRDRAVGLPRGRLTPEAFTVEPFVVEGAPVLLFDDTWTSGRSAASAAAALKNAGADHVTVLTIGRQLNPGNNYGSSEEIYEDASRQRWDLRDCVLCA
jgi:predicted amidophosphoribosyltransferase